MGGIMPHASLAAVITFPALLDRRLAVDPGQPLVTFYDDATGERTELSVKTFANWVSKTANLYADELMLDPGDTIAISLPPHWLTPVFLAAAWTCGLHVTVDTAHADVAVVGPDGLDATSGTTLACALTPFATPFREPLPSGVLDHGVLWPAQSDVFSAVDATQLDVPAGDDRRVLTDVDPLSSDGQALFLGLVAGRGSLVLVAHADERQWPAHSESVRATDSVRTGQPTRE
jgi:uncharacterized protein (TIGR03089 family)